MRASGGVVAISLAVVAGLGVLAPAACTYTSSGQGGAAAELQLLDGAILLEDGAVVTGNSSGGEQTGNGSGEDAGTAPSGNGSSGGSSTGGGSGGSSGGAASEDASAPVVTCPPNQVVCGENLCCAAGGGADASTGCPPPPSFTADCAAFINDQNAGSACVLRSRQREELRERAGCFTASGVREQMRASDAGLADVRLHRELPRHARAGVLYADARRLLQLRVRAVRVCAP